MFRKGSKSADGVRSALHEPLIPQSDIEEGKKPTSLDSVVDGNDRRTSELRNRNIKRSRRESVKISSLAEQKGRKGKSRSPNRAVGRRRSLFDFGGGAPVNRRAGSGEDFKVEGTRKDRNRSKSTPVRWLGEGGGGVKEEEEEER